jgi:uncharacterized iron-regulated membrane protein
VATVGGILRAGVGHALSGLLLGLPLAALAQAPPGGQQPLSPQEVEQAVGERLGVQVLGVARVASDDRPRYAVTVMNPPGDANAALLVTTLLVDAVSGEILGEARTERAAPAASDLDRGLELRRRTYR